MLVPDPARRADLDTVMRHPWLAAYAGTPRTDGVPSAFGKSVADLEKKLSITLRWEQDDLVYQEAVKKCNKCKYQLAVNHLESLVVAWLFELVKMNHGRTGMLTNLH